MNDKIKQGVILKPGKEKPVLQKHHWIFSGAIQKLPPFQDGDFLSVYSSKEELLGSGYFNRQSSIIGRMVSFDSTPPIEAIEARLIAALQLRNNLINKTETNAYRLVNGEGDGLPGLVIDIYDKVAVIQISTLGMDKFRDRLVEFLEKKLQIDTIYEKSQLPSRREEGLQERQGLLKGKLPEFVSFKENGLSFLSNLEKSQKTGFFLDQREMRQQIRTLSSKKRVLNAFSYTGGFSVYALAGGATKVDSVDISADAIELAKKHVSLNGFSAEKQGFYCDDVFEFLRNRPLDYDLVILDPPAFAKKKKDVVQGCRGYKDINRLAIQKMPPQSLLLTCSCSYYVDEHLFQQVIFQAALEAKRTVRIIGRHRQAADHPINIYHPESDYLKSFLLYIE